MVGVENVDIEVTATNENFVVCLVLDASAFERIVQSHTISMQVLRNHPPYVRT